MTTAWGYGLAAPPAEALAVAYFTPLLSPLPVTTRQTVTSPSRDTVDPYLRVESAGGFLRADEFLYDISIILHSYAPQNLETTAETNMAAALGWGAQAYNTTITVAGTDWWVAHSWVTAAALKQNDPLVNLTRYRGMVTWRIPGHPIPPPAVTVSAAKTSNKRVKLANGLKGQTA